ncbi:MAG: Asp-tRNA(Asn)/Glu-tRNA(Gln) amidotransferase subunit GatA [Spirochaetales bacterium]|nr:Asp-tRNA(Asn)/Glu-tRNA(Gln) amidotransferase subunit GatA [Spirochaetales bacterium]
MKELIGMSLSELKEKLDKKEMSTVELVRAYLDAFEADRKHEKPLNGYIEVFRDSIEKAEKADEARVRGSARPLEGLPFAVKDNIVIKGKHATCASGVLKGFCSPYSATVVKRLVDAGMIPLGRTNMDEFGMGSSCEYSIYGATRNPVDRDLTPGGSSGGSAAVVASGQAPVALGTETGGSVRTPASYCGVYGLKPSYGTLSRYGVVAYGSSLDQIGILAKTPQDIALMLSFAAGADPHDMTSAPTNFTNCSPLKERDIKGLKVLLPTEFLGEGIDPGIKQKVESFAQWFKKNGAQVDTDSVPILQAAVAIYYIIAPAEASSNLARYDGVRYGNRVRQTANLEEMYVKTRSEGFGKEVKRRIFIGNYVLSSGYYDAYYKKAMQVRTLLRREIEKVFSKYDLILSPTSPCPPFKLGEKVDDPLAMYLTDICTTFSNLALIPSLSVPVGTTGAGLPVGVQLAGNRFREDLLLEVAAMYHKEGSR